MTFEIKFTEDELRTVRQILEQELETVHAELRRTHNMDYKEQVRHRIEAISHSLHAIEDASAGSQKGEYVSA